MNINLDIFRQLFLETVSTESQSIIESFYLFGSLARGEKIQSASDIDSILVLKDKDQVDFSQVACLSKDLIELDRKLGVNVDHLVLTQDDLFELLSPTLIINLHADGINIFGKDLKQRFSEYLAKCPKNKMLNSFLRTDMFRRHMLRRKYLKLDLENNSSIEDKTLIEISKDNILTARDLLYFETGKLITPKREICSYFLANITGADDFINFPMLSYNVRYGIVTFKTQEQKLEYLKNSFEFMEQASLRIQERYKSVTGESELNLRAF